MKDFIIVFVAAMCITSLANGLEWGVARTDIPDTNIDSQEQAMKMQSESSMDQGTSRL